VTARKVILPLVLAALVVSVLLNIVLSAKYFRSYRMLQSVCLDPMVFGVSQVEQAPPDDCRGEPLVVMLGDSRIAQWSPLPIVGGCRIVNRGVGGQTTALTLLRLQRDVLSVRPCAVVIQIGVNDLKLTGLFPERRQVIVDSCQRNIQELVNRMTREGIQVMLLTIFPPGPAGLLRRSIGWGDVSACVEETNRQLLELAGPCVSVLDCDPILKQDGHLRREYAKDTLHLTPSAYEALNRGLVPVLEQLLQDRTISREKYAF